MNFFLCLFRKFQTLVNIVLLSITGSVTYFDLWYSKLSLPVCLLFCHKVKMTQEVKIDTNPTTGVATWICNSRERMWTTDQQTAWPESYELVWPSFWFQVRVFLQVAQNTKFAAYMCVCCAGKNSWWPWCAVSKGRNKMFRLRSLLWDGKLEVSETSHPPQNNAWPSGMSMRKVHHLFCRPTCSSSTRSLGNGIVDTCDEEICTQRQIIPLVILELPEIIASKSGVVIFLISDR